MMININSQNKTIKKLKKKTFDFSDLSILTMFKSEVEENIQGVMSLLIRL